jgi:hypothetical protein
MLHITQWGAICCEPPICSNIALWAVGSSVFPGIVQISRSLCTARARAPGKCWHGKTANVEQDPNSYLDRATDSLSADPDSVWSLRHARTVLEPSRSALIEPLHFKSRTQNVPWLEPWTQCVQVHHSQQVAPDPTWRSIAPYAATWSEPTTEPSKNTTQP